MQLRAFSEHPSQPAHALGDDAAGLTFASSGERRAAYAQNDRHEQAEEEFLRGFAGSLHRAVAANDIKRLILVAPARAMGVLRPFLSEPVRRVLAAELIRDYARMSIVEIEQHLQ